MARNHTINRFDDAGPQHSVACPAPSRPLRAPKAAAIAGQDKPRARPSFPLPSFARPSFARPSFACPSFARRSVALAAVAWAVMLGGPALPLPLPLGGPQALAQSLRPFPSQPLRPNRGGATQATDNTAAGPAAGAAAKAGAKPVARTGGMNRLVADSARVSQASAEEAVEPGADDDLGPASSRVEGAEAEGAVSSEGGVAEDAGPVDGDEASATDEAAAGEMAAESSAANESSRAASGRPIQLTPRSAARTYAPEKQIPRVFSAPAGDNRTAMRNSAAGSRPINSVLTNRDDPAAGEGSEEGTGDGGPGAGAEGSAGGGSASGTRRAAPGMEGESGHRFADAPELFAEPWAEPLHGRMGCWWVSGEYLMWWRKGIDLPAMASDGPLDIGTVLYGNQTVGGQARPGGRLSFGWAGGPHQRQGWFARVYFMETGASDYSENDTEVPGLSRPFLDLSGTTPELNAVSVDSLHVRSESDFVGGDILMRQMIHLSPLARVDFLLGYQFARIDEKLRIDSTNGVFQLTDQFATANEFHGGALGLQFIYDRPGVRLDMLAKVGLGSMQQEIVLDGSSSSDPRAGLLVQSTNRGTYTQSEFAAIPEFGATITWAVSPTIEFSLGYSLLYFPGVVQAASGVDSQLAVDLVQPATRPRFVFQDNEYWVHGLNLGLTWRY